MGSLAIIALSLAVAPAEAQPRARGLGGTWSYVGTAADGERIVESAVAPALARMRPDLVPIARERIAESTWLPTRIRITAASRRVEVALTGRERRTFRGAPGQVIQVPLRHGYAQLTQGLRADGALEQRFVAIDGTQENVFVLAPDGTLRLEVTLRSPQLPDEIRFQLVYRRGR